MTACLVATLPNNATLWVGDWADAAKWCDTDVNSERVCVLEGVRCAQPNWFMMPIKDDFDHVNTAKIDAAADKITKRLNLGKKVLCHCAAGIERSPLTCAWWMRKTGVHSTLAAAYTHLKIIRPIVEDRTHWLDADVRLP